MKLLIVDDEPAQLAAINDIVREAGYVTVMAESVVEAIAYLESGAVFSLILADLIMPERSGLDLLDYVRFNSRLKKVPVIVCSGFSRSETVARALRFGAKDFIVKPIAAEQLLAKIEKAINAAKKIVLVVSPDPLELELLTKLIERESHHVVTAFTAQEALEQLGIGQLYAVIAEPNLADMSATEFATAVKRQNPSLPVILISSSKHRISHDNAVKAGADGVIERPFKNVEIAEKLRLLDSGPPKRRTESPEE